MSLLGDPSDRRSRDQWLIDTGQNDQQLDDPWPDDALRRKLLKRRGGLHGFSRLDPPRTALVVIDAVRLLLDDLPGRHMLIAATNRVAASVRAGGGTVAWVIPTAPSRWRSTKAARALLGGAELARYEAAFAKGGTTLAEGLKPMPEDWLGRKTGYSSFFPGNADLPAHLAARGIDTVILAGTLTTVCVEASARDAFEVGYRVILCADACAANTPEVERAAIATLGRCYADIRSADGLHALLRDAAV